jgi:hypothetical protein
MAIGTAEIYRTKNAEFFFHEFFAVLTTFWRISAKLMSCWRSYCAVGVPADANTVVAGLPLLLTL